MTARVPFLHADRRAAISLMTAVMAPVLLGTLAFVADAGFWIVGSTQLQVAADAAAMGAGQLLGSSLKTQSAANQSANLTAAAKFEAQNAATKLVGTMNTPVVTPASDFSYVDVTVTSQAPAYLIAVTRLLPPFTAITPPLLRATARATYKGGPKACILTLAKTGTNTIEVDNSGTLAATSCPIFDNSSGAPAIHASGSGKISETGAISGNDIGAVGTISSDNGGSISAATVTSGVASTTDPNAGIAAPTAPTTYATTNTYNAGSTTYNLTPTTWNGTVTFNNSVVVNFAPGTYYVNNGTLNFNGATATFNTSTINGVTTGVNFVITGSNPGNFAWTNYTNSTNPIIAPTTGSLSGIAIYQACNSAGGQTTTFNGGSTLTMTGTIYAPCSAVTVNNKAVVSAANGMPFSIISLTLTVSGSAAVNVNAGTGTSSNNAGPVLTK